MLLTNSIKESTSILAQALLIQNPTEVSSTHTSKAFPPATTFFLDDKISRMKSRLTKVQNTISSRLIKVKENMETRLGDIISLLDRIPAIIDTSGNQGRDEAQASRA